MSALTDVGESGVTGYKTPVVGSDEPQEYTGPMIDLSVMKDAVRRRRNMWVGAALAGLVIGAVLHLFVPATYTAGTDLYMVEPSGDNQAIGDDVSVLETRAVAQRAVAALRLDVDPERFLSTYSGLAVSDVILSIKLSATSPARAVAYDNAVANAFLAVRAQQLRLQTNTLVDGLKLQVTSVSLDASKLTKEINSLSTSKAGPTSADQLAALVTDRSGDASEISQLEWQEQQDVLAERATVQGSQVLDPAEATKVSVKRVTTMDGLSGLVGGLGLGLGIVIVGAIISDRPRRRADVAAALGVPVELSVGKYRPPRVLRRLRLRWRLPRRWAMLEMVERRLRRNLEEVPGSGLAVVAVGPNELAALGIARLAYSLASQDMRVVVVDLADGHPLAWLFGVKGKPGEPLSARFLDREFTLVIGPDDPAEMTGKRGDDGEAVLVLANLSPGFGAEHLTMWTSGAVVVVTAGEATATQMSATTQMLNQAGVAAISALLIGAGPEDESVGTVMDQDRRGHPRRLADYLKRTSDGGH